MLLNVTNTQGLEFIGLHRGNKTEENEGEIKSSGLYDPIEVANEFFNQTICP